MIRAATAIVRKDLKLVGGWGGGLIQALLLGLLLLFMFSLSRPPGERISAQAAATIFWLASAFGQVLVCNALYSLEEVNGARLGLLLAPAPVQGVWLGKALAGLLMLLASQAVYTPLTFIFLDQSLGQNLGLALAGVLLVDLGLASLGSLLGALAQGQAARESLLSLMLFPLLAPGLLAGIRTGAMAFEGGMADDVNAWLGIAAAFAAAFAAMALFLFPFVYGGEE